MATNTLMEYDHDLCDYILGQIRPHLRQMPERLGTPPDLDYGAFHRLRLSAWIGRQVAGLPSTLSEHVWAGVHNEPVFRSLDTHELTVLSSVFVDPPMRCESEAVWTPFPGLHLQAIECIPQVRAMWTQQTAEEWASDSAAFGNRLCEDGLPLDVGVSVVRDWLWCLRRLSREADPKTLRPRPKTQPKTITAASESPVCGWREAMQVTGLKKTKLYELFRNGRLTGYKDGGMIRFYRSGLASYMTLSDNTAPPPAVPIRKRKPRAMTPSPGTHFKYL